MTEKNTRKSAFPVLDDKRLDELIQQELGVPYLPEKSPKVLERFKKHLGKNLKAGVRLIKKHDYMKALSHVRPAWEAAPDDEELQIIMAHVLGRIGARDLAIKVIDQALTYNPLSKRVLWVMGTLAQDMSLHDIGEKVFKVLISIEPENESHYVNLATSYNATNQPDASIELCQKVLPQFPNNSELWNVLATAVYYSKGARESHQFYEEAIRLSPDDFRFYSNYAATQTDPADQEVQFRLAIDKGGDDPEIFVGLGMSLLWQGKLEEGFKYYGYRHDAFRAKGQSLNYVLDIPKWEGEDIEGKTILLCNEQGIGDEVMYMSVAPALVEKGAKIAIGCDHRLVDAYKRSFPEAVHIEHSEDGLRTGFSYRFYHKLTKAIKDGDLHIDYYAPVGTAAGHIWKTKDAISAPKGGLIKPCPDRVAKWRDRLAAYDGTLKIGISWQSMRVDTFRKHGYFAVEDLLPVLKLPGVTAVNLQYGAVDEAIRMMAEEHGVDILSWDDFDVRNDLDDNFALMDNLDIVIGPGIATQSFAAAVGAKTRWILHTDPWWTFGHGARVPFAEDAHCFFNDFDYDFSKLMPAVVSEVKSLRDELYPDAHKG